MKQFFGRGSIIFEIMAVIFYQFSIVSRQFFLNGCIRFHFIAETHFTRRLHVLSSVAEGSTSWGYLTTNLNFGLITTFSYFHKKSN